MTTAFFKYVVAVVPAPMATPSQEDVLRSISENVSQPMDIGNLVGALAAMVAVVIVLILFNQRRNRAARPKVLNHQAKLLKEITRAVDLSPLQIKQLRGLADRLGCISPLTVLLCPSIVKKQSSEKPPIHPGQSQ